MHESSSIVPSKPGYRSDIDGLRALAVIPVVLYHAGIGVISGGFVGVDIFFVISGFLITGILHREITADNFSLIHFYERRVRRIFPALFAVLAAVLVLGYITMLPDEFTDLSKSALFTSLSAANFYFLSSLDYFGGDADTKPLLHMWSLAVEEQFYLIFPAILFIISKSVNRRYVFWLSSIAICSFLGASIWVHINQSLAFYTPHLRAWELLLGGVIAVTSIRPPSSNFARTSLPIFGLFLIVSSIFLLDSKDLFPGLSAAPVCLGTGLIIWCGKYDQSNIVSKCLSIRPVVFIGLISYSLYLWHWPIMVFLKEAAAWSPVAIPSGYSGKILSILASFAAAVLSWKFIEKPFRERPFGATSSRALYVGGLSIIACAALSTAVIARGGLPGRFPSDVQVIARVAEYDPRVPYRQGTCFLSSGMTFAKFSKEKCLTHQPDVVNYMLIGDSHAAQYWWGLHQALPLGNVGQATASGCRNVLPFRPGEEDRCVDLLTYAYGPGIDRFKPDVVIIAGRWRSGDTANLRENLRSLKTRVKRVILIGPSPQYDAPLPKLVAAGMIKGDPSWSSKHLISEVSDIDSDMRNMALGVGVEYLSPYSALCSTGSCRTEVDGLPIQFDYGHFTASGSVFLSRIWADQINQPPG